MREIREKLLEFLKALEVALPPANQGHHAITICRYGSDDDGCEEKLGLHVHMASDKLDIQTFFLESGDLEKPTEELVVEISEQVNYMRST